MYSATGVWDAQEGGRDKKGVAVHPSQIVHFGARLF